MNENDPSSGGWNNQLKDSCFWYSSQYIRERKRLDDWAEAKICSYYNGGASWSARFWEFLDVLVICLEQVMGGLLCFMACQCMWYVWDTCSLSHNTHDLYYLMTSCILYVCIACLCMPVRPMIACPLCFFRHFARQNPKFDSEKTATWQHVGAFGAAPSTLSGHGAEGSKSLQFFWGEATRWLLGRSYIGDVVWQNLWDSIHVFHMFILPIFLWCFIRGFIVRGPDVEIASLVVMPPPNQPCLKPRFWTPSTNMLILQLLVRHMIFVWLLL